MLNSDLIIESLDSAIVVIDQDYLITRINVSAETLLGQSRRYLLGQSVLECIAIESLAERLAECFANGSQFTLREQGFESLQGNSLVDVTLLPLQDTHQPQNKAMLIELKSVSRIAQYKKDAEQIERQQSLRLMMRGLAHEIKNPLGGIRGAAQLLERQIQDKDNRQLTSILIKEADRLTRLVDRVMGLKELLKLTPLNIHEVLEHVLELVSVTTDKSISSEKMVIERAYDPTLPEINADKEQLIQVMLNIIGNAIEAQQDENTTTIGLITQFVRLFTISGKLHRAVLNIKIWDDGGGVPEAIKERLFEPFVTSRAQGTGLGLSIAQEIVQRHSGIVQLEDWQGKTCFSIYLPYLDKEQKSLDNQQKSVV